MNFLNLEYFLIILEEGSFSRAARRLFVSQQTLSGHVKKLEDEVGAPLLVKEDKLKLTAAGECFTDGVMEIFRIKKKLLRDIAHVTDQRRKKISLGITDYEAPPFLPDLLIRFSQTYPEYECLIVERDDIDISQNMAGIDLYVSYLPIDRKTKRVSLIENERCAVVGQKALFDKVFKNRRREIREKMFEKKDLSLLKELPYITPIREHGYKSRYLHLIFDHFGFSPVIGFKSDNGALNASMCINGAGVDIAPLSYCAQKYGNYLSTKNDPLEFFEINIPSRIQIAPVICYENDKRLHHVETNFIEFAKSYMATQSVILK